jgi:hypothetical protein
MSYYGYLSAERLAVDAAVAPDVASAALVQLQAASIVSIAGVVGIDSTAEDVRAALATTSAAAHADALVPVILRARYNNIYKLVGNQPCACGEALPESTWVDIVRNNILIDVQGKDMLCQIFTSNVLQRAAGDEAPFLEFIQRMCYEGNDSHGQPVPMRPGCGGFGIRNFLTLFLSVELNKAMSDLMSARASQNEAGNPCSFLRFCVAPLKLFEQVKRWPNCRSHV